MNFILDPKLEKDSALVCLLNLSQVRLHNNAAFPWIVLIPQKANMVELIDLSQEDQIELLREITITSRALQEIVQPDKLNVANLGNIVSQLHVHVIARFRDDKAWPHPVWNSGINSEYSDTDVQRIIQLLRVKLIG